MTLQPKKKISNEESQSMEKAVQDADIRAIHPDKLETFAAHLVNKLREDESE